MERGTYLSYGPWSIEADLHSASSESFLQSIFFQGNGKYGLRATLPGDTYTQTNHGMYQGGCFEYIQKGITDMVNLPDPLYLTLDIDKKPISKNGCKQTLHMHTGILLRRWLLPQAEITYERLVSFSSTDFVAHRICIKALSTVQIDLTDKMDASVMNLPIHDDQTVENEQSVSLLAHILATVSENRQKLCFETLHKSFSFTWEKQFFSSHALVLSDSTCKASEFLQKGENFFFEAVVSLSGENDALPTFSFLAKDNELHLNTFWKLHDIEIGGPVSAQAAIRYAIYTLKQNAPQTNLSIGARGLTHARYKGCYFWDAEVFLLPYYLYTDEQIAKRLLTYRIETFDAAKDYAASLGHRGARYPWMSALDGSEQCESWDTGKCELHISADIAWAMELYQDACKEEASFAQITLEIARFYASRFSYVSDFDQYEMFFVKGPNEYGGVTKNNTFTTMMALHTIDLSLRNAKKGLFSLDETEQTLFEAIRAKAKIPYSQKLGTYLEDDLFSSLEPFDLSLHKKGDKALYHTISYDRLQRYQVIKQPDVLLLYLLLPHLFTEDEALNAWNVYERLTSHDSTLSWGMHAFAAYRLGIEEDAYSYLEKAMFLDLENLMDNTASEGLHVGAMGAFLQALLFGAAGLVCKDGEITIQPRLPKGWETLRFSITYRGCRYRIECTEKKSAIQKISLTNE